MKLDEVLNSQVPYLVVDNEEHLFSTKAHIGNRDIFFSARKDNKDPIWSIQFSEKPTSVKANSKTHNHFDKTGSGNELQVFSFVTSSIKDFISRYKPTQVNFLSSNADGNRSKLYLRLAKRVQIPGYSFIGSFPGNKYDSFVVTKDKL